MKKLTTLLMTLMLMSTMLWADQTVTVSANSSDISEGLDLKVVAKLFAEAKNLEEFETMLNNPDSAFCNLDLNGDGQVDYLRVVETGEGSKRLIVLQAVLAKDIYQDVASIYVEKDENEQVSVQVVGDEYVYGANYVIEPVYIYRPLIYDWLWCDAWYAWHSPWYWDYWPGWWRWHACWAHDWYWHHCYAYHHHHHWCTFRHATEPRRGYHEMHNGVTRSDYARVNPNRSFSVRNNGMTNAREIRSTTSVRPRQTAQSMRSDAVRGGAPSRSASTSTRSTATSTRTAAPTDRASYTTRTTGTSTRSTSTTSRQPSRSTASTGSTTRSTSTSTATRSTSSTGTTARSTGSTSTTTRSTSTSTRSTSSTVHQPSRSSSSSYGGSSSTYSGSRSGSSSTYSGSSRGGGSTYSGGSSRGGGSYSGGGSSRGGGGGGGSSRGGGGGSTRR